MLRILRLNSNQQTTFVNQRIHLLNENSNKSILNVLQMSNNLMHRNEEEKYNENKNQHQLSCYMMTPARSPHRRNPQAHMASTLNLSCCEQSVSFLNSFLLHSVHTFHPKATLFSPSPKRPFASAAVRSRSYLHHPHPSELA